MRLFALLSPLPGTLQERSREIAENAGLLYRRHPSTQWDAAPVQSKSGRLAVLESFASVSHLFCFHGPSHHRPRLMKMRHLYIDLGRGKASYDGIGRACVAVGVDR